MRLVHLARAALVASLASCSEAEPVSSSSPAAPRSTRPQAVPMETSTTMALPAYMKATVRAAPATNYEVGLTAHDDGAGVDMRTMFDRNDVWHGTTTLKVLRRAETIDLVYVKHQNGDGKDTDVAGLKEGDVIVTLRETPDGVRGTWVKLAPANLDQAGFVPAEKPPDFF